MPFQINRQNSHNFEFDEILDWKTPNTLHTQIGNNNSNNLNNFKILLEMIQNQLPNKIYFWRSIPKKFPLVAALIRFWEANWKALKDLIFANDRTWEIIFWSVATSKSLTIARFHSISAEGLRKVLRCHTKNNSVQTYDRIQPCLADKNF